MSINAPVIQNPVMLDRVIGEIQTGLVENLPWLDVAFGRSQRLTRPRRKRLHRNVPGFQDWQFFVLRN